MAYDFQKLADVELLEEVPDGASAFVAVDGTVKRVPGSGLGGGGGIATAILRLSSESNASTNAATMTAATPVNELPITCDNYTYEQARAVLEAGNPLTAMIFMSKNNMSFSSLKAMNPQKSISGWVSCSTIAFSDNYISMMFITGDGLTVYWNADGFFDREPVNRK